jgi:hypothetical protein
MSIPSADDPVKPIDVAKPALQDALRVNESTSEVDELRGKCCKNVMRACGVGMPH